MGCGLNEPLPIAGLHNLPLPLDYLSLAENCQS